MKKNSILFFLMLLVLFLCHNSGRGATLIFKNKKTETILIIKFDSIPLQNQISFSNSRYAAYSLTVHLNQQLSAPILLPLSAPDLNNQVNYTSTNILGLKQKKKMMGQVGKYLFERFISGDTTIKENNFSKKSVFLPSPFISYAPETDLQFGALALYSFYIKADSITRVSAQSASFTYTLLRQYKFEMDPDIWTSGNKMHFTGTFIYQSIPLNYYGIGYNTRDTDQQVLASKQIFIDAEAEKEILKNFRLGLTLVYSSYNFNLSDNENFLKSNRDLYKLQGSQALFGGISVIYDSRNFLNSTTHGAYLRLNTAYAPGLTSTLNPLLNINLQGSYFLPLGRKSTIGLNTSCIGMYGTQVPFYFLPQLGGSNILRGYYSGRYRDKNALQFQTEYRFRIIQRIELAAFAGMGTAFGYEPYKSDQIKENYGGGIRYFFDLPSRLTLRLDYGIGEKPQGENRINGIYFQFGEAF